jgi:RHS repeat-associated protein
MTSATDYGGTLSYTYSSQGNLLQVKLGATVVTTNVYDEQGRQKQLTDPNAGTTQYEYDALGQLAKQTNASGQLTTTVYDKLGRSTTRTGAEGTTTYEYFGSGQGVSTGKLKKITGFTSGNVEEYTYDNKGRVATKKETIDGTAHTISYGYDGYGRVNLTTYPSGLAVQSLYDASGQLTQLKQSTGTVLYTNTGMNGLGQTTSYSMGNGKSSTNSYYFGTPTKFYTAGLQDLRFEWNYQSGNLSSRNDVLKTKSESFTYDNLNRLTGVNRSGQSAFATEYLANGNIKSHDNYLNFYTYDAVRTNAVISQSNRSSQVSSAPQNITYTPYYQPDYIGEGGYTMAITYGPDYERIKSILKQGSSTKETRYYFDGFEKQTIGSNTKYIQYLGAGDGVKIIVVSQGSAHTPYYVYTDYLGSILTVTGATGAVVAEQSFDAWGRRRSATTWDVTALPTNPDWLYRGYTSHEELARFNLINMNGRLYDPVVGRMLSVDNYVQAPGSTQSYNRYSYAMNNPLRYTDPSGEFAIALAVIAGMINLGVNLIAGNVDNGWEFFGFFAAGMVGASIGMTAGAAVGAAFSATSFIAGASTGAVAGFSATFPTSVGNSLLNGKKLGDATVQGLKDGAISALIAGTIGGIGGGMNAVSDGRNFWHGGRLVTDTKLPIMNFKQVGRFDCSYNCAESIEDYYGGSRTWKDFYAIEPGSTGQGLTDSEHYRMYIKAGYKVNPMAIDVDGPINTANNIAGQLSSGHPVNYVYTTGQSGVSSSGLRLSYAHATVVTRMRVFDNGRFIMNLMNPATGSNQTIRSIRNAHLVFSVIR